MRRFFWFFSLILLSFLSGSLLINSSVNAQSTAPSNMPPFLTTNNILLKHASGSDVDDVTSNWSSYAFDKKFNTSYSWSTSVKDSYMRALEGGTFGVVQVFHDSPSATPPGLSYSFEVFWTESSNCIISLRFSASSGYYFYTGSPDALCRFQSVVAYKSSSTTSSVGGSTFFVSSESRNGVSVNKRSLVFYKGSYVIDADMNGYNPIFSGMDPASSSDAGSLSGWNDNCGLDISCHLGNIGIVVKALGDAIFGIFNFSEDNTILKFFKWLFIPDDLNGLLDFSNISDGFKTAFKPVFDSLDLLRRLYDALIPRPQGWTTSNYCSTSLVGDAGVQNSSGSIVIFEGNIFNSPFKGDLCSFERAFGGHQVMSKFRIFTASSLILLIFFMWFRFIQDLTRMRF